MVNEPLTSGLNSSSDARVAAASLTGAKPYIRSHTAIRGIAALGVFFYHLQLEKAYRIPLGLAAPAVARGYVWVDLFFILSGFVLSLNYQQRLSHPDRTTLRTFLVARAARIVPLHLVTLAYLAVLVLGFDALSWSLGRASHWAPLTWRDITHLGLQAVLLQIWDYKATLSWNIPSWSISAEMHIYLLLPLIAMMLRFMPRRGVLVLLGNSVAIYLYFLLTQRSLDILSPLALVRCLAGFALGVAIQSGRGLWLRLPDTALTIAQIGAISAMTAVLLSGLHDVCIIPAFALLVLSTSTDRGFVGRMLVGRRIGRLGDVSYSLYLLNFPVLMTAGILWPKVETWVTFIPNIAARTVWMAALTIVIVLVSNVSYAFIERPLRLRVHRRFDKKPKASSSPGGVQLPRNHS